MVMALLFMLSITGCGSDGNNNNNGTLTLVNTVTDLGGGRQWIVSRATVTSPVANAKLEGLKVMFTGKHFKKDGSLVIPTIGPLEEHTNPDGTAEAQFYADGDTTAITYFEVAASVDGLFAAETISIPISP